MKQIRFLKGGTVFEVSDELNSSIEELNDYAMSLRRRVNELEDAIRYAKMKAETAAKVKGKKQSRWAIPEAIKAREYLYGLVNGQRELFR